MPSESELRVFEIRRIEIAPEPANYRVEFLADGIDMHEAVLEVTLLAGGRSAVTVVEPSFVVDHWFGDADSLRRVMAAVTAFHDARGASARMSTLRGSGEV